MSKLHEKKDTKMWFPLPSTKDQRTIEITIKQYSSSDIEWVDIRFTHHPNSVLGEWTLESKKWVEYYEAGTVVVIAGADWNFQFLGHVNNNRYTMEDARHIWTSLMETGCFDEIG